MIPTITSKDNRLIKLYAKLCASKSTREKEGLFTVEGYKLFAEAVKSGMQVQTVFVTEALMEKRGEELEPLFAGCGEVYQIPHALESKLSQVEAPQGIYAMVQKPQLLKDTVAPSGKSVLLVDLQDAGNVGTIIRTAEALGITHIYATAHTCDFYNPKVVRSTMGSLFRMKLGVVADAVEAISSAQKAGIGVYASVVSGEAEAVGNFSFDENSLLLIGNEGNGLSKEVADAADHRITIHMSGNAESLNASAAACILMWEMLK